MISDMRHTVSGYDSKFRPVNSKNAENLSDYVRRIRAEKGLSTVDVETQSGSRISDSYVTRIENGYVKNVSPEKLQALAKGLGISEEEIFAVALGKTMSGDLQLEELRLLEYFRTLPADRQEDALALLEAMSQRHGTTKTAPSDESLPHGGRPTIRVRAGKYVSQHSEKALRKKQG